MALPNQLKSARMTDSTPGSSIDDYVGELETALCDIFGFTINTNVTESPLSCDNSGRITKSLIRLASVAPCGIRFRDTSNSKEFRLALNNTSVLLDENTGTEGTPVWTNRLTIALGTGLVTMGSATDPSAVNDLSRKAYVDNLLATTVKLTGDQSVGGIKTFTSIPVLPASSPTTDNQATRKKYVDDEIAANLVTFPVIILKHRENSGVNGGGQSSGSWATRTLNQEFMDTNGLCSLATNQFTLQPGTYDIEAHMMFYRIGLGMSRLYNVTDAQVQQSIDALEIYGNTIAATQAGYSPGFSVISGRFTIASAKVFVVQSRIGTTNTGSGWGEAAAFGVDELYSIVKLTKVA